MEALLTSLFLTGVSQAIKLLTRTFGIDKKIAKNIVLSIIFLGALFFTISQKFNLFSQEQIQFLISVIVGSIGSYEVFLNKTGIDSYLKNQLEIKRDYGRN